MAFDDYLTEEDRGALLAAEELVQPRPGQLSDVGLKRRPFEMRSPAWGRVGVARPGEFQSRAEHRAAPGKRRFLPLGTRFSAGAHFSRSSSRSGQGSSCMWLHVGVRSSIEQSKLHGEVNIAGNLNMLEQTRPFAARVPAALAPA